MDAKGGCLLATINRNLVSVIELIPETNTALCNELRLVVSEASTNITKEMQDSKKRPLAAPGDDPAWKLVEFYHPSGKEQTGTLEEKAQMMPKLWGEIQAARGGTAPLTPAPGDTTGAAPSSSAPPVPSAVPSGGEGQFLHFR